MPSCLPLLALLLAAPAPAPAPSAPSALIGTLGGRGVARCDGQGYRTWEGRGPAVGLTPLQAPDGVTLTPLMGRVVIAHGRGAALAPLPPSPALDAPGACPIPQMRSDWIETPRGMVPQRRGSPAAAGFIAESVAPWHGLALGRRGDRLHFALTNTLDAAWREVVVDVHYEGCYGKPGTAVHTATRATLGPRTSWFGDAPAYKEPPRGVHRAASVQVRATSDDVLFDFDAAVYQAGVDVGCPERGKRRSE